MPPLSIISSICRQVADRLPTYGNPSGVPDLRPPVYDLSFTDSQSTPIVPHLNLKTAAAAKSAMDLLERRVERLGLELGAIGAVQSRLNTALSLLRSSNEDYQAAESRIRDAELAQDASVLLRQQILQRSSAALLAQSMSGAEIALQLIS